MVIIREQDRSLQWAEGAQRENALIPGWGFISKGTGEELYLSYQEDRWVWGSLGRGNPLGKAWNSLALGATCRPRGNRCTRAWQGWRERWTKGFYTAL